MSVAQVGKMSAAEMDMWMIRAATQPFMANRLEVGLAQIAMLLHNTNCKKGQHKDLSHFMLFEKKVAAEAPIDSQILDVFGKMAPVKKGK